jgi:hypothetical protein
MDWAKRVDPDGAIDSIAEILNENNPVLDDAVWVEGNLPTGHRTTIRTGLPTPTWRLLNYGVQPGKSTTAQVTDSVGMLEAYSEVDKDLADLNGNSGAFRLSEDRAHLESMSQTMASTLFYGNTGSDPEKFMGLAPRFASTSADNGRNIILAGGDTTPGDNLHTSIWLIVWGENTCHMVFPKGSTAGLQNRDLGEETLEDANGGLYQGYRSWYQWKAGLTVRDWRYVVRIANIEQASLTINPTRGDRTAAGSIDLVDIMTQALETVEGLTAGRAAFYMNRRVASYLRRQITGFSNVNLTFDNVAGKHIMTFDGVPIRRTDAIVNTEAVIS